MAKYEADGVYAADPNVDPTATKFEFLTYRDMLNRQLKVMDTTALSLCMENKLPIMIFNMFVPGSLRGIIMGEKLGSLIAETRPE